MSLKEQIDADIKTAMLARQKDDLLVLRSIKSMLLLASTEKGAKEEVSGEQEMKILVKAAKQRKESADIFKSNSRDDLAAKELMELEVINRYLPKQMSDEDVKAEIVKIVAQTGAESMGDMGKVMGMANKALAGKADGKLISTIVKSLLS